MHYAYHVMNPFYSIGSKSFLFYPQINLLEWCYIYQRPPAKMMIFSESDSRFMRFTKWGPGTCRYWSAREGAESGRGHLYGVRPWTRPGSGRDESDRGPAWGAGGTSQTVDPPGEMCHRHHLRLPSPNNLWIMQTRAMSTSSINRKSRVDDGRTSTGVYYACYKKGFLIG